MFVVQYRLQKHKAAFERWAKQRAIDQIDLMYKAQPDLIEKKKGELLAAFNSNDKRVNYSFEGDICQQLQASQEGSYEFVKILLGAKARLLSDDDFETLFVESSEKIQFYMMACNANITKIQEELGWNSAEDPEGKQLDPKKARQLQQLMKKAGYW